MELFTSIFLFLFGFFILIRGAQILVKGASSIAKILNISTWFIGVVVVGIGTSIPELSLSLVSAFEGSNVGLGVIIGNSTFNILVILGISALLTPIVMKKRWIKDFFINAIAVAVAALFVIFPVLGDPSYSGITREEGMVLFGLFILWIVFMFRRDEHRDDATDHQVFTFVTSLAMILGGVAGVFLGGHWVVSGVETLATALGVSASVIALTIIGAGTSLPELTVSIVAALRKNVGIAVGNVLGSSIFDFLGILGITALIHPIAVSVGFELDILAVLAVSLLLLAAVMWGRGHTIGRLEGLGFIFAYVIYLIVFFIRG